MLEKIVRCLMVYTSFAKFRLPGPSVCLMLLLVAHFYSVPCPIFHFLPSPRMLDKAHKLSSFVGGAARLNSGEADIAINWAGGLHHAKKSEASGFCYVNDCVLGALELLKQHQRVLYIDIDIHHGDGVEEAFYNSNRVMTLSLHKYGEYFPGTGDLRDIGYGPGSNYAVNAPLRDGMDDMSYGYIFRPVLAKVMEKFRPTAVVLQCGADSLSGDRLGCFNLSLKGHGDCVAAVREYGVPTLVLGGGGYTMRNVARCWAYETSLLVGTDVPDELPYNDFFEYYGPDYRLHITPSNMENLNDRTYLEHVKATLLRQLDSVESAPGVQINTGATNNQIPKPFSTSDQPTVEDLVGPDGRVKDEMSDRRMHQSEYFSGEADNDSVDGLADMQEDQEREIRRGNAPPIWDRKSDDSTPGTTGQHPVPGVVSVDGTVVKDADGEEGMDVDAGTNTPSQAPSA